MPPTTPPPLPSSPQPAKTYLSNREKNVAFAQTTKKTVFSTNLFNLLKIDDALDGSGDEDDETPTAAGSKRKGKGPARKKQKKAKVKPKPFKKSVVKEKIGKSAEPSKTRNTARKADDELIHRHNKATFSIGSITDALNPILRDDPTF